MVKKSDNRKQPKAAAGVPADVKLYIGIVRTQANEDMKRHMSAMTEQFRDDIKGISERFVDFDRKLDSHTEMIGALAEDVATLTDNVATLTGNVATLTKDVSIIKEKVSSIEDGMKNKVDRGEFAALDRRVTVLETNA